MFLMRFPASLLGISAVPIIWSHFRSDTLPVAASLGLPLNAAPQKAEGGAQCELEELHKSASVGNRWEVKPTCAHTVNFKEVWGTRCFGCSGKLFNKHVSALCMRASVRVCVCSHRCEVGEPYPVNTRTTFLPFF